DEKVLISGKISKRKCFNTLFLDDFSQKGVCEKEIPTVLNLKSAPNVAHIRNNLQVIFDYKTKDLIAKVIKYQDIRKCGMSYRGTKESPLVIGIRIGSSFPLYFRWFLNNRIISKKIKIELNQGDI